MAPISGNQELYGFADGIFVPESDSGESLVDHDLVDTAFTRKPTPLF